MTERLNRIVTRGGDRGTTGLADGSRVSKDHPLIEAMGEIDELNCILGLLLSNTLPAAIRPVLADCQQRLFDLGGELAMGEVALINEAQVTSLEQTLHGMNSQLPPLNEFVVPGGSEASARAHLARAVCRRVERRLVSLNHNRPVNPASLQFINRLSDWLFVAARVLARSVGSEPQWQNTHSKPDEQSPG